jgi:hypothetical protein
LLSNSLRLHSLRWTNGNWTMCSNNVVIMMARYMLNSHSFVLVPHQGGGNSKFIDPFTPENVEQYSLLHQQLHK